jgi:hypothetical protein
MGTSRMLGNLLLQKEQADDVKVHLVDFEVGVNIKQAGERLGNCDRRPLGTAYLRA